MRGMAVLHEPSTKCLPSALRSPAVLSSSPVEARTRSHLTSSLQEGTKSKSCIRDFGFKEVTRTLHTLLTFSLPSPTARRIKYVVSSSVMECPASVGGFYGS